MSFFGASPQFSILEPVARGFVVGGSIAQATGQSAGFVQNSTLSSAASDFSDVSISSWSLSGARTFRHTSVGLAVERLNVATSTNGAGLTRMTAGVLTRLRAGMDLSVSTRYGVAEFGHTIDSDIRLRGTVTDRLFYGLTAHISALHAPALSNQSRWFGAGIGYSVSPRTVVTFDATAGWLRGDQDSTPFGSAHVAVQRDLTKHLFTTVSVVKTLRQELTSFPSWRSHYVEAGGGWRFSPVVTVQYVFATDNLTGHPEHIISVRYTSHNSN